MTTTQQQNLRKELSFTATRSSGAGGQNVNKVNTKVELRFEVQKSEVLSDEEKALATEKLAGKLTNEGILIITSQEHRSQFKNKETCIEKFYDLLDEVLKRPKVRKKRKTPKAIIQKRLDSKQKKSEQKSLRKKFDGRDL